MSEISLCNIINIFRGKCAVYYSSNVLCNGNVKHKLYYVYFLLYMYLLFIFFFFFTRKAYYNSILYLCLFKNFTGFNYYKVIRQHFLLFNRTYLFGNVYNTLLNWVTLWFDLGLEFVDKIVCI